MRCALSSIIKRTPPLRSIDRSTTDYLVARDISYRGVSRRSILYTVRSVETQRQTFADVLMLRSPEHRLALPVSIYSILSRGSHRRPCMISGYDFAIRDILRSFATVFARYRRRRKKYRSFAQANPFCVLDIRYFVGEFANSWECERHESRWGALMALRYVVCISGNR